MWDAGTGELLLTLTGHRKAVSGLAYSPDGRRVATSSDHTAKVGDARTGARLADLADLTDRIVLRRPDGAIVWPVPSAELVRIGCLRLRRFEAEFAELRETCEALLSGP